MSSNNVITFPKQTLRPIPKQVNHERLVEKATNMKIEFYNEMADDMIDTIVRQVAALDLNDMIDDEPGVLNEMDIIILRESIVSLMCRLTNLEHPLQPLLKGIMNIKEVVDDSGEVVYTYTLKGAVAKKEA